MKKTLSPQWSLAFFLALFFLVIKVPLAISINLSPDEAHYALYGFYIDWSYVDHPPLVGWLQFPFSKVQKDWVPRIPALLLSLIFNLSLYKYLFLQNWKKKEILLAFVTINTSFLIFFLNLILVPDTLLMSFTFPLLLTYHKIKKYPRPSLYIQMGVLLGLLGLSKYSAIFFVPALLLACSLENPKVLFNKYIFYTIVLAALIVSPVFVWNMNHEWVSFSYQTHRVFSGSESFLKILKALAIQFFSFGPLAFILSIVGIFELYRKKKWAELFIALSFPLVFLYSSFREVALPHWFSVFYIITTPYGVHKILRSGYTKSFLSFLTLTIIFLSIIYITLLVKWNPGKDYQSLYRDIYGWPQIMNTAEKLKEKNHLSLIAVTNWSLGSRAKYYAKNKDDVFVLDHRKDQFDFWPPSIRKKRLNILIIQTHFFKTPLQNWCTSFKKLKELDILLQKKKVNHVTFYTCQLKSLDATAEAR